MDVKKHVVQSDEWGKVKTELGTKSVLAGGVLYTKHKIPFTNLYFGYAPKVNPANVDFEVLKKSAIENNCVAINFDCPNVLKDGDDASEMENIFKKYCVTSNKQTFAKNNILLDLTSELSEIEKNIHSKARYNIRLAEKKGVKVREGAGDDIEIFIKLNNETAKRQKFYVHSDDYYRKVWEILSEKGIAKLLIAEYEGKPLTAWMLFIYDGVLYYPYGASSSENQNLFANNLVCFEAIKIGKFLGCNLFDMWGAAKNPEDATDSFYGFTRFKLSYGGKHVEYIDSYDLVINPFLYNLFLISYKLAWKILKLLK